jgi:hypothetical protein
MNVLGEHDCTVLIVDVLLQFLVCALAFASFTCSLSSPQSRLQLTFILLLTTVTFKFAVNKNIPRIPYLTLMVRAWTQCCLIT